MPLLSALVLLGLSLAAPGEDPRAYLYFDSAETESGPVLRLTLAGGETRELRAASDTALISYLPERKFARLPQLAIDRVDHNRALLAFSVERGLSITRAELALVRLGAAERVDLERAVEALMNGREQLGFTRKMTSSWLPPHGLCAYFHSCAYYHGVQAVLELGADDGTLGRLRADLFTRVEPDGTWVDTHALGRPYATAMTLLALEAAQR